MISTLVIRMSALGDVAMTIPVLYSVAKRYPENKFIFLTKNPFQNIFINPPSNLKVITVFTKEKHKGLLGIGKLIKELSLFSIDKVADLHDVLRSRQIDLYFRLKGKQVAVINKGRKAKKQLISHRSFQPLQTSIERYQQVFEKLGFDATIDFKSLFITDNKNTSSLEDYAREKNEVWIGIAPFAQHKGKIYPSLQMESLIQELNKRKLTKVFLFGGSNEATQLEEWSKTNEHVLSVAGKLKFSEELLLMSNLNLMVTMDSANMHLASLVDTPVISIWGATHPYTGFYGYNQDINNAIQLGLDCRPCSVYGNKPCKYGTYECLLQINPNNIIEKIDKIINSTTEK